MNDDERPPTAFRLVRVRIGWTTGEVAARLGLDADNSTVRAWDTGRRAAPPSLLARMEEVARAVERAWRLPDGWTAGPRMPAGRRPKPPGPPRQKGREPA